MEEFLAVIALIVYLVAAASGKKKKAQKKKQRKQRIMPERDAGFEQAFEQTARPVQMREAAEKPAHEHCAQQRLHLHEVTQTDMQAAAEGEDPCHAGDFAADDGLQADAFAEETAALSELSQDVLRGVIMSEILTRPCERMAGRRNRRSAV